MELFDGTAQRFAERTDDLIARGRYFRGALFVTAAKQAVPPNGRILDYGCGPGRIAWLVAREGYRVVGVDPSPGMIRQAELQVPAGLDVVFRVIAENGEALDTGAFDGVICSSVIEYVPNAEELLRHFHRSLVSGGVLIISYANKHSLWRTYERLRFPAAPYLRIQHHLWGYSEFSTMVRRSGFEIVSGPRFFACPPLDERYRMSLLSSSRLLGTLALVVARARPG